MIDPAQESQETHVELCVGRQNVCTVHGRGMPKFTHNEQPFRKINHVDRSMEHVGITRAARLSNALSLLPAQMGFFHHNMCVFVVGSTMRRGAYAVPAPSSDCTIGTAPAHCEGFNAAGGLFLAAHTVALQEGWLL